MYTHAKMVIGASTRWDKNVVACIEQPINWTMCHPKILELFCKHVLRVFNMKGCTNYPTSMGHELDLMHQMSQPYFGRVRMRLTLPKWRLGSPPRLPKLRSSIVGVKTPRIKAFFISLESYQSVDVENELAWAIWTSTSQVMEKRKAMS
jgi:hypothetical protein